jgi:ectoine hydroxylase-related dioxygenase (phytanoyl-CoA dioxygenase family)
VNSYQVPPSFRFHFSRKGSSSFHRDRDYGVDPAHLNVWIPFTRVWGSNSIWIESEEGKGDYSPVSLEYGQALIFDGPNLCHGSVWNNTTSTRVSMDFRFSPRKSRMEKACCSPRLPASL